MASFKTHISFGIALGAAGVLAVTSFALVPAEWGFFTLVILAATMGAILPDVDSDSGLPFHITFGSLALIAGGLSFLYAFNNAPSNYWMLAASTIGAMFMVWVIFGSIFKKFTHHRGMAHSVPAVAIAGMVVFSLANRAGFDAWVAFLLGLSLSLGFMLHLVLDEVWAAVNFHGRLFIPNKALGSAVKFYSGDRRANALTYLILTLLMVENGQSVLELFQRLFEAMR